MPARKRIDPTSRPADGRRPADRISGADPTRHYVFANPNDEETGVAAYEAMGYEVEKVRAGGPRSAVGKTVTEGGNVTSKGQILMSCPMEDKEARDADGQAIATGWEKRILRDGNVDDGFRGRGRMQIAVDPDKTAAPTVEYGA